MAVDQPGTGGARRYVPPPDPRADDEAIRISDAERGQIIELLSQAATEGRLTWDEYTERTDEVYAARFQGDLAGIIDDLPHGQVLGIPGNQQATTGQPPAPAARPMLYPVPPVPTGAESSRIVAVLGNESRRGRWTVPRRMQVESYLGECHLALNDATFEAHDTTIEARAVLGSITIIVPEGVEVRLAGRAVLGTKEARVRNTAPPGAPSITVVCDVLLGSVKVRPQRWGWAFNQLQRR